MQAVDPAALEYVLNEHKVQPDDPLGEYLPGGHKVGADVGTIVGLVGALVGENVLHAVYGL